MSDRIELQIPEFAFLLKQETVLEWQLYGLDQNSGYQRIGWEITSIGELTKINITETDNSQFSAEVDFRKRKITFFRGEMNDGEFTKILSYLLSRVYLQVGPKEIHFIAPSKNHLKKTF